MRVLTIAAMLAALLSACAASETKSAAKSVTWLSALTEQSATMPRGQAFAKDGARGDGGRIAVQNAADCSHSLSAHAPSRVTYQLGRRFHHLNGAGAIDSSAVGTKWTRPCVVFVIIGDGKELWRSPRIGDFTPAPFAIDVAGVDVLEIIAEAPTAPKDQHLHRATWVEPQLAQYGQRLVAAEQAFRRASSCEADGSFAKAMTGYGKAAREGGIERFAIEAEVRAAALHDRRLEHVSEVIAHLNRDDADAALATLAVYRRAWGDDDESKALSKQARESKNANR